MSRLRSLRKIDILGYLLVLMGLNVVTDHGLTLLAGGPTLPALGGLLFGIAVVAGGLYARANPKFEATTEPAPGYLYVVAGIGTVAFLVLLVLRFVSL